MNIIKKGLQYIPTLNLSERNRIMLGIILIIPLFFGPWFLSIPIGVLGTSLGRYLGIGQLGRLVLRLAQIVIFYIFGLAGVKFLLGRLDLGLRLGSRGRRDFFMGTLVGVGSVFLVFLLMLSAGWLQVETFAWQRMAGLSFAGLFIIYLISNLSIGVIEEVIFRGYLVQVLNSVYGRVFTVISAGLIFSLFHLLLTPLGSREQMFWLLFELIPAGLLLCWVFVQTDSLMLVIGLHASYNFGLQAFDIYGRYGANTEWGNLLFLGNSVQGNPILVGTPGGSAGLIHILAVGLMAGMTFIYLKKRSKQS